MPGPVYYLIGEEEKKEVPAFIFAAIGLITSI
jgi:hypothetical protein